MLKPTNWLTIILWGSEIQITFAFQDYNLTSVNKGDIVAAPFENDNTWYRAKVMDLRGEGELDVFYVDYGDSAYLSTEDVRELRYKQPQIHIWKYSKALLLRPCVTLYSLLFRPLKMEMGYQIRSLNMETSPLLRPLNMETGKLINPFKDHSTLRLVHY